MKVKDILKGRTQWMPSADQQDSKPVVSVLLPTWKRAKGGLFEAAVRSVLDQTFRELELIIVDDCSTDGTFEIIQRIMKKDRRVSCIRHTENIGLPAISEFEAYQKARGTYIAFIFDDNEWNEDAIEQLVEYAQENHVKALAGQYMLFVGGMGASFDDSANWSILGGKNVNISNLLTGNCFGNGAVLLNRETIETVGFLDPNIALSRCWDWDLWRRIAKEYRFEMTDIMVGKEKGTALLDSLGNTHQMYQWAAQERMHQPRNEELLPKNYLECDIFEPSLPSSPFLYRSNCWLSSQYEKKPWFNDEDPTLRSIRQKSTRPWHGKRIAYLTSSVLVNASSTLNWGRLPYSEDYVIFYSSVPFSQYHDWVLADAIIIERELSPSVNQVLFWAKSMGIPCYWYVDDNFKILAREYANTYLKENMRALANNVNPEYLRQFEGIFCSTAALQEYFAEKNLHKNFALVDLVYAPEYVQPYHKINSPVNIAFFGSTIRGETFVDVIFPVLRKLSQEYDLHMYCPDEVYCNLWDKLCAEDGTLKQRLCRRKGDIPLEVPVEGRLTLYRFPRTLSTELALQRFADKEIQIQIHCGPVIENNRYKTVNALLNAVCMGAVLVATDDPPYSQIIHEGETCLLAENTEEAWEEALRQAMDPQRHQALYQNALEYCKNEFDAAKGRDQLVAALEEIIPYEMIDLSRRLLKHISFWDSISGQQAAIGAGSSTVVSQGLLTSSLYLNSLGKRELVQTLQAAIPGWEPVRSWPLRFLPIGFSKPLTKGNYTESRLPQAKQISLVLTASEGCTALLEFVVGDSILRQEFVNINGVQMVRLDIPDSVDPVRLRIANHNQRGYLYVLQRNLFSKSIFEITVERGKETTDE